MNILLLDGLPDEIHGIPISPDYRNMVQLDIALHDADLTEQDRLIIGLRLLYPGFVGEADETGIPYKSPVNMDKAIDDMMWFFACDRTKYKAKRSTRAAGRAYDFNQDASMIYAAFYSAYGINLATINFMHWWEFIALMEGLPDTTMMAKVIYWRTADVSGMSKEEKKHVLKMRNQFRIESTESEPITADELEQRTKDKVKRRMEEAQRVASKNPANN